MPKSRLEAFSDGVIAIVITIMVLELKVPHDHSFAGLSKLLPVFLSYVLSFIYVGIYWNNHHHLLHSAKHVTGGILWANLHLLFWISLIPFASGWMGENHFTAAPMMLYGVILFMCSVAFIILQRLILKSRGTDSPLAHAIGRDHKGKLSIVFYALAIGLAFVKPWISGVLYVAVALNWLVPDKRMESAVRSEGDAAGAH